MHITKFERDAFTDKSSKISSYEFVNVWPTNMTSMRVAYGNSNVLRLSVRFAYDRFFTSFNYESTNQAVLNKPDYEGNDLSVNQINDAKKAKEKRPWWLNVYTLGGLL